MRWLLPVASLLLIVALVLLWHVTPLREFVRPESVAGWADEYRARWYMPLLTIGVFVMGGFLLVPLMGLVLACGLTFGPWLGAAYALAGSLASAAAGYGAGHRLGHDRLKRLAGRRLERVSRQFGRGGILAVFLMRKFPVAPFTLVNLAMGASHVSFRDFMIGTTLGLTPGIVALAVFGHSVAAVLAHPTPESVGILVGIFAIIVIAVVLLQRLVLAKSV